MSDGYSRLWEEKGDEWEILYLSPDEIKGISQYNARKTFPDKELEELVISLREAGINTRPIILDQHNEVVEGGRRYQAALKAGLEKVFCLRKTMTPLEAKVRSFIENELSYDMTERDRYLFAKDLVEKEGIKPEDIAFIVGRSHSTVREWLAYEKYPKVLSESDARDVYDTQSARKRKILRVTIDNPAFQDDPEAALKLAKHLDKIRHRTLDDIKQDVKEGVFNSHASEKVDRIVRREEELSSHPEKFRLRHLRVPRELDRRLIKVFKFDYPKDPVEDAIVKILEDYVNTREKELGFVR